MSVRKNHCRISISRRAALVGAAASLSAPAIMGRSFAQDASDYPRRRLRIIVPFPPGATTDSLARAVGQKLEGVWGRSVAIENIGGAGGLLGTSTAARAAADGYTFLLIASSHVVVPYLMASMPYDYEKDFASVTMLGKSPSLLIVTRNFPPKTFKEFIEYAKTREIKYGSSSIGTVNHIGAELLRERAGIKLAHVPYKGGAAAMNDILGGHLDMTFGALSGSYRFIQDGKARGLAVTGQKRSSVLPDVPTLVESGYDLSWSEWFALVAPAGTPRAIVEKASAAIANVLKDPEVEQRIPGIELQSSTPAQLDAFLKSEAVLWGGAVKRMSIKIE